MKYWLTFWLMLLATLLPAVLVHGHLTQDTTWSPDNNPYILSGFVYVDAGVTLTILPGVEVKAYDATNANLEDGFKWHGSQEPAAKMIIAYGRITAVGTPSAPIVFDNYSGDPMRRWGGILIRASAPPATLRYCNFSHQYAIQSVPGLWVFAAINPQNGILDIRNCRFHDFAEGIECLTLTQPVLIYGCSFEVDHFIPDAYMPVALSLGVGENETYYVDATIARCDFRGEIGKMFDGGRVNDTWLFNNTFMEVPIQQDHRFAYGIENSYGNYGFNAGGGGCRAPAAADTAFCRRNIAITDITNDESVHAGFSSVSGNGTIIISDNYGYGNTRMLVNGAHLLTAGYIYNNQIYTYNDNAFVEDNSSAGYPAMFNVHVFNNKLVSLSSDNSAIEGIDSAGWFNYNTVYGFSYFMYYIWNLHNVSDNIVSDTRFYTISGNATPDHPILSNNCISFPITYPSTDGGGNFTADPMFADTLGYDLHLQPGSPCIDAGTLTADLPAFDADYNLRVAGAAPDLGAYESNSTYIGGIIGSVYDAATSQPLDCARIKISGKLPEFSDSLGWFTAPTGAGNYTLTVQRFDYADVVIPNVQVTLGVNTMLDIPLQAGTGSTDPTEPAPLAIINLYNYPNPFRDQTTLSYILPDKQSVQLSIYNLKGQKVTTLAAPPAHKGLNTLIWDGTDNQHRRVAAGIYICTLKAGGRVQTKELLLMK